MKKKHGISVVLLALIAGILVSQALSAPSFRPGSLSALDSGVAWIREGSSTSLLPLGTPPAATPGTSARVSPGAGPTPPRSVSPLGCSIAFGMYQHNAPWSWGQIDAIESQINRHSAIVHWYSQWGNQSGVFSATVLNLLRATRGHGSTPMITWEPWNTYPITNNPFPLTLIAAGAFDAYVDSWATGMAAYAHPVLLVFAQEMNGNWYPWGDTVNGSTSTAFVAAWRHLHDRFLAKGARNVQWVFDPDGDMFGSFPNLQTFYPGDAYVDWLGVDVYNFGTTQSWSSWKPLSFILRLAYARLTSISPSKPLILAEFASVEQGGSKGQWILSTGMTLPSQFPRVRAIVWFSENGSQLALNSSTSALSAARSAFGSAPFCSTLSS